MIKHVFLIFLSFIGLSAIAQNPDLNKADKELARLYDELRYGDWETKDSLVPEFTNKLYATLAVPESFDFPFDSLSTRLDKVVSPDNKVNIWSWDQHTGGSWAKYISAVQFQTEDGKIGFRQLNSGEEMMLGGYTDVYIYKIHEIEAGEEIYYLTFGRGTHGSGNYHRLAQVFTIKDNEFVRCEPCFEDDNDLVLEVWRGDEIKLDFDPANKTIRHTVLNHDDMRNTSRATDEIQQWQFRDGRFKRLD